MRDKDDLLAQANETIETLARFLPEWIAHPPNPQCDHVCEAHRALDAWREQFGETT